jgi:hypothetical protein
VGGVELEVVILILPGIVLAAMPIGVKVLEEVIRRTFPVAHLELHDESSGCGERYSIILVSEVRYGFQLSILLIIKP